MDKKIIAPYLLNAYVWGLLQANTAMRTTDYGGKVPIIPGAEPDLTQYAKPYLVYGYTDDSTILEHAVKEGNLSYLVYSSLKSEISTILNILSVALERGDESAIDVNTFTSSRANFIGIRFGSITIAYLEGPEPEDTEGGRASGMITIHYSYFSDYKLNQTGGITTTGF